MPEAAVVHCAQTPRLTSTTRAATPADPIGVFAQARQSTPRALWFRPASGEALVAVGSALDLVGGVAQVAAAWRDLVAHAAIDSGSAAIGPRLLGGFCFDAAAPGSALWDGFGPGRLVLPERMLTLRGDSAWLTTNRVTTDPLPAPGRADGAPRTGLSPEAWQELVGDVAHQVRRGEHGLRKVVLARAQQARTKTQLDVALRTLASEYPSCTIFAIGTGDVCFLGATPESLVALHAGTATTMALAGSFPRGATPDEDRALSERLLRDPKERTEHALVVQALREGLARVSTRVVADAEPRLRQLSNVQHLITPIRAQVARGRGVLDLVEQLHPTPAVGGTPRVAALSLIREREALDRGWYAGPIGWVDASGDGEFMVGLRSALVRRETATLFAGCGIVGDSDPATELAEWGWKLRPMRSALGLAT